MQYRASENMTPQKIYELTLASTDDEDAARRQEAWMALALADKKDK